MKRKVSVQLSEQVAERLETAAQEPGASKSAIVEAALDQFLSADTSDDAAVSRRLNWMSRQLEQLERDLRIVNETVALHARYHLTVTPPLPSAEHRAACALGVERFEVFAAQVGRRVHLGTPLMRETMDRLGTTKPELFAGSIEKGIPLAAAEPSPERDRPASRVADKRPEQSAAAQEGGSNPCFLEESSRRPQ
jgi:predicted transcriptional regulator